jgi:DNA-binding transcriptional LysR family regulator/RimJ/RimL family protein N-acetyltransferase
VDLDAVRTFVAVADAGQFQHAAADLSITQQAVSKRIAALEKGLGVRLFTRTARGAQLTIDGQAFLPHARLLLQAEERAADSVRPGRRALRVDVIGRQLAPSALLRDFHRAHPETELDVVTLFDADSAIAAVRSGTIDASFRAVTLPARQLPDSVEAVRVLDEPIQLLTGPSHEFAAARAVTPAELAGHRIWMPGIVAGTEWAAYYDELAAAFGLTIDSTGPNFGIEPLLDVIADSPALATFVGEQTRLVWPADYGLRRIAMHGPKPVYPHSLIWRGDNPHPALTTLRNHLGSTRGSTQPDHRDNETWTPKWAQRSIVASVASLSVPPTLRTERLLLEPYVPTDEAGFIALFQDTRVSQWMGDGPASEAEDRALFGRIFTKVYSQGLFDVWAVRRDGVLVGHAEIKPCEAARGYEIIYALAPSSWGLGLGTELAEAIVAYGFDALGQTEVHATVAAPNKASLTLLARIGFEHVRDIEEDDGGTTRVLTRRLTAADRSSLARPL